MNKVVGVLLKRIVFESINDICLLFIKAEEMIGLWLIIIYFTCALVSAIM
jgi:hypothetical protein